MLTINEIEREAAADAATIEIQWNKVTLSASDMQAKFRFLDDLCTLYEKLTAGKSVLYPDEDTALPFDDIEKYTLLVADELYNGFVVKHVYLRYQQIERILADSGSVEMVNTPYINNPYIN